APARGPHLGQRPYAAPTGRTHDRIQTSSSASKPLSRRGRPHMNHPQPRRAKSFTNSHLGCDRASRITSIATAQDAGQSCGCFFPGRHNCDRSRHIHTSWRDIHIPTEVRSRAGPDPTRSVYFAAALLRAVTTRPGIAYVAAHPLSGDRAEGDACSFAAYTASSMSSRQPFGSVSTKLGRRQRPSAWRLRHAQHRAKRQQVAVGGVLAHIQRF
ncbi:MAG: hypothetical protein JWO24_4156, partial [Rhodospirillales bacterium]|nr:hypothetical protein [Rhodospirillales bacterium]